MLEPDWEKLKEGQEGARDGERLGLGLLVLLFQRLVPREILL